MWIVICTQNASLFASTRAAFEEDGVSTCVRCSDQLSLMKYLSRNTVDLVLLDGGREFAPHRTVFSWRDCHCKDSLPIIVLGQHFDLESMTDAFNAGANDIVVGPLSTEELLVRAQRSVACCSRHTLADNCIEHGPYRLDRRAGSVLCQDQPVRLTPREFAIAWLLFSNPGALLSRDQIAMTVWGKDFSLVARTLEQHVYKLRIKLGLGQLTGVDLMTVYSHGYRLTTCAREQPDAHTGKLLGSIIGSGARPLQTIAA